MRAVVLSLVVLMGCGEGRERAPLDEDPPETGDNEAPELVAVSPVDGATGVDPGAQVVLTFSEPLAPWSVRPRAVSLSGDGRRVAGSVVHRRAVLRFTPDEPLEGLTRYVVDLDPRLADPAGNRLGPTPRIRFTTAWEPGDANVVHLAWKDGVIGLWRTDFSGPEVVKTQLLSDPAWEDLGGAWLSPDGLEVAVLADTDTQSGPDAELFVIPLVGGAPVRVSEPMASGTTIRTLSWAPDGSRLAFLADADGGGNYSVFVVSADGSGGSKLSGDDAAASHFLAWAPDSRRLSWVRDHDDHLLVGRVGHEPVDVSGVTVQYGPDELPRWSPDGTRLAYRVLDAGLFVVPAAGGTPTWVVQNPTIFDQFQWRDAATLLWRGCLGCYASTLHRVPAVGGTSVPLLQYDGTALCWSIAPGGDRVAYYREAPVGLYVADTTVEAASAESDVRVTTSPLTSLQGASDFEPPVWSPDGAWVLYRQQVAPSDPWQLHLVAADGAQNLQLTAFDSPFDEVPEDAYGFSPDGKWILYGVYDDTVRGGGRAVVFRSALDGTVLRVVNADEGTDAASFQVRDRAGVGPVRELYDLTGW